MRKHPVLLISLLLTAAVCSAAAAGAALTAPGAVPPPPSAGGSAETTGAWSPTIYWDEWPDSVTAAPALATEPTETVVAVAEAVAPEQGSAPAGSATSSPATGKTTTPPASSPAPAPAPAPAPTPPPPPPAPAAPEVIGGYGSSIASYINPAATYDSTLQSQCIAQAKRMALAGALSHSSYAPESCARYGDGMVALGGGGGGVAGDLYGHCPQLGSCSRLGVGLVLYNGVLYAVAQGGD
ncbi:MAG TPA: hypothetical protein ENN10_02105 [Actinobacteria bacterium]|nr:hypothetical protein [Actinomycetota bacterium]